MHCEITNLNTQVLKERAVRCMPHSTQPRLHKLLWNHKAPWFCFKVYRSLQPGIQHCFFSFLCHAEYLLHRFFWLLLPLNESIPVHTPTVFMLPSPACGEKQQRKLTPLSPVFMDLLILEGSIDKCFLANSLQSQNSMRRVGNWVGWRSCELNHHRRLSIHKGEFFFLSLTKELR